MSAPEKDSGAVQASRWLGAGLPFDQVHGHTSLYRWDERVFRARAEIARRTTLDEGARHETTKLGGARIVGIDPGHGPTPRRSWRAWTTGPSSP